MLDLYRMGHIMVNNKLLLGVLTFVVFTWVRVSVNRISRGRLLWISCRSSYSVSIIVAGQAGNAVPYAVIPSFQSWPCNANCFATPMAGNLTNFQASTLVLSHELAEVMSWIAFGELCYWFAFPMRQVFTDTYEGTFVRRMTSVIRRFKHSHILCITT